MDHLPHHAAESADPFEFDGTRRRLLTTLASGACWLGAGPALAAAPTAAPTPAASATSAGATVLCYHRFGPAVADSMTVRTARFEGHLRVMRELGCNVIPLSTLVDYLTGRRKDLPPKAVVITVDDGHITQFTEMRPVIERAKVPVTLFIYPSAISNASYAMTWDQLRQLHASPLVEVAGHTYWHPNFKQERKKQKPEDFVKFVNTQLVKSKTVLEKKLGKVWPHLAWPFGIYDPELMDLAQAAGYEAAFTLDAKPATRGQPLLGLPRYLMIDSVDEAAMERLLKLNHGASHSGGAA
ncbi:polysaccharide deacetylase family protein [Aquabacterium sp.]|uniref:polysaccharide deacetylase family protein n=1 Tax=Aquabacterium sp. TaxID=1872578 RepID=UPI0035B3F1B4